MANCSKKQNLCCHQRYQDKQPKRLVFFDFDQTIVNQDSTMSMCDLLPQELVPKIDIATLDLQGWIPWENELFRRIHECGVPGANILARSERIPETPGMIRLIRWLKSINCDMVIVSNSCDMLVSHWVQAHSLNYCFLRVISNPAEFEPFGGPLVYHPYTKQCECKWCAWNMCKGQIVEDFLKHRELRMEEKYLQTIYVGDGYEDFCAGLRLKENDIACVRTGYRWERRLKEEKDSTKTKAKVVHWKDGYDLQKELAPILCSAQTKCELCKKK